MLKKIYLYLLLLSSFAGFESYAQSYPISVSTQIKQPSPIYLSHYADASTINSPIKIQIVLNDLTISNRQVKLKIYFQGNGISFNTNDFVAGARPLYLEGGVPLQLTNVDLAPYFEYQNLLGLTPNQYAQPLPEGLYNIYVEVYDFATGRKLSNKTGTNTIIFQNDPPFLNLPLNNASFMQQNIQNIVFGWTPRSINVSNVEYEFSLVEIWDKYTPVQNAFAYSPPLYTTTTRNTTLQYGINEPQLIPGKKYAWRVKAKAIFGAEEIGVFKNNGYSEIFSFDYETYCTAPLAITTSGISENQAKITWSGNIDNYDYEVNYREKNADSEWYKLVTPRENLTLSNLKPNAVYEYTVGASCEVGKYTHSTIKEFTTLVKDEIAFQGCGIKPDPKDLANKNPLPELFPNDVVTAGDFPIVVLHSTGSNGTFTGDGYVTLPFLEKFRKLIDAADALGGEKINIGQFSRIKITFKDIGVNTDFKLISGEIVASYDAANWDKMLDVDKITNDIAGSNGKPIEGKLAYEVKEDGVTLNPDGSTTIKGTNGESTTLPKSVYDQVYIDKSGDVVNIPANGSGAPTFIKAAEGGRAVAANTNGVSSGGEVTQISSPDVSITFEDGPKAIYAFDELPDKGPKKLKDTYETLPTKDGSVYNVNYKAVSDLNGPDTLIAEADFENGKTKDDIVFKTNTGAAVDVKWTSATKAEIKLKRTLNFSKESIIATVKGAKEKDPKDETKTIYGKSDIAGKVNIWQLTQKPVINITLLSVNGASSPGAGEAKNFFNEVYNKVGIKFDVTTQKVAIGALPNEIQCGESGVFDVYTNDQNNIISQIESSADFKYNDKTYYVIYTGKSGQNGYKGFMPLGGQYAFVFNNGNIKTAAHELGHGIFGLKHPFSAEAESGKTDLLMDYGDGTVLSHNNWDIIHSGGWKFYGFQKSSDGALAGGYGLTPQWEFVQTNTRTILSGNQIPNMDEGMLGAFEYIAGKDTLNYIWNAYSKKYKLNGNGKDYEAENYFKKPSDKAPIWLIFKNNEPCNNRKYLRTDYNERLKTIIEKHDTAALAQYIADYSIAQYRVKDKETRSIYWGDLGCNLPDNIEGNGSNVNYKNYVVNLGKNANKTYTEDKTDVGTQTTHVFDLATVITSEEKQKILGQLGGIKNGTGILCKIYLIDANTPDTKRNEITGYLGSLKGKEIGLLIDFKDAEKPVIKTFLGDGIEGKGTPQMNKYLQALIDILPKFDGTYTPFNPLTAMLDGLAGVIGEAKIPIRFYNPDEKDYNPIPGQVYSLITFSVIKDKVNNFISNNNEYIAKYSESRCNFAFTCGIWNGLVTAIGGVPEGASMIIKLITNEDDQAVKLWNGLSKLSWSTIGHMAGEQWDKYSANPCMASYATGEVGFIVISCFYGAGEAKGLSAFFQTLDRLDAVGAIMGKFAKLSSPFIKAGVNKLGKFVITPLAKLEPAVSKKLRDILKANFKRILKRSDQISISLHATDQGKFLVDGIEYSPEELGELLSKKLSDKKEIILLSCNDLASAKALSEATGKVVYTTEGAITVFENGVQRAEGTKWYKVEPNGTTTEVAPPVNECGTNCIGDGAEMGKTFSGNLDKQVLEDLEKTLGSTRLAELLEITKQLPSTWTIKKLDGKLVLVDSKGKKWAEIFDNEIHATAGDAGQGWNKLLNVSPPLMKNFRYVVDNGKYIFETDDLGRVNKTVMEDLDFSSRARKESYQQDTKVVKDGLSNDDGGHIFRNEWGGPSEQINYFSQNAGQNRAGGDWFNMEKAVSDFKRANPNKKLKVEMEFYFDGNSKRPISTRVDIFVDGIKNNDLSKRAIANP
ncbi:DNA/RNA non-specific endonuclease [Flavobacterium hibisci]|uniref:DNA/RNA non-specific endonuclease n=1 Tax=Flavobacterium hibisci TaxID=1914462 RepID=UPI001CBE68BC|nr:DNA/RNA non-specific endonuclease [Flavobacterium hibisci]MBZ4043853.1 DNA/RNA non-specific endonuclease [Flavobacterium hibisci]